jgi:pimeloyl-ACP methyl ester carboxylesterase
VKPAQIVRHGEPHAILLGGGFTEPDDFVREGFVARLLAQYPHAGVTLDAMPMALFADGSAVDRIAASVEAARTGRARRIWLAGISLGGLGALAFTAQHAGDIAGLVLMSPYPGTRLVQREIEDAGGLDAWSAHAQPFDLERETWLWLAQGGPGAPPTYLFFGNGDRFIEGQRRLAQAMKPVRHREIEGGHEWSDWGRMWDLFLAEDALR